MTPIEIIASIVAIITIIKLIVVYNNPLAWIDNISIPVIKSGTLGAVISLILAGLVLKYLLEVLTIVEIYAVSAFFALLFAISFMTFPKKMLSPIESIGKDKDLLRKSWLPTLIWLTLSLWVLKELFF